MRIPTLALLLTVTAACAPTAEVERTADGCRAALNRGWLTEQRIRGFRASCDPKGVMNIIVEEQDQRGQSDLLEAVARGAAAGATPGP